MDCNQISVIDAAANLGKRKQQVFKVLKRLGIQPEIGLGPNSHGQKIAYLSMEQYFRLEKEIIPGENLESANSSITSGVFYLIQLEPELDPGRFKLGYASNLDERIRTHRTSAPLCKLVKSWPCKQLWEKTAIDSISQECEQLHTEVFRANELERFIEAADLFFSIMPDLNN